jgi:cyclophilin family peptidyl-prolyl cis-trans isomerase
VIVTNLGEIEIELNAKDAPKHTENFIKIDARQRPNRRVVMERVYED